MYSEVPSLALASLPGGRACTPEKAPGKSAVWVLSERDTLRPAGRTSRLDTVS